MDTVFLKDVFILHKDWKKVNEKNPLLLEVENESIDECLKRYGEKEVECVIRQILFMSSNVLNFPHEHDRAVHVQFENVISQIVFLNNKLVENVVCSFDMNDYEQSGRDGYIHVSLNILEPQIDGVLRTFVLKQIKLLQKTKCTFLNSNKEPLIFEDDNFNPVFIVEVKR